MIQLLDGEKIIEIRRQHWFVIVGETGILFAMAALPFAALILAPLIHSAAAAFFAKYWAFIMFYWASWMLFLWFLFFITWTNYYLDLFVITNKRVIDIEQFSLFVKDFAEIRLENVQDIKVEVVGFIQSFFKMGNIHIQTAGQAKEIFFRNIPDPYGVKHTVSVNLDQVLQKKT